MQIEAVGSLFGYFRGEVEQAEGKLRVRTGEDTKVYVAQVLTRFAEAPETSHCESSLVLSLEAVFAQARKDQAEGFQRVGDAALYVLGFFPEYLARDGVGSELYLRVGGFAYGRSARLWASAHGGPPNLSAALVELSEKLPLVVDVVAEVAQSSALGTVTRGIVQAFDRWKRTGSSEALEALLRAGVVPGQEGEAKA